MNLMNRTFQVSTSKNDHINLLECIFLTAEYARTREMSSSASEREREMVVVVVERDLRSWIEKSKSPDWSRAGKCNAACLAERGHAFLKIDTCTLLMNPVI